jgi:diacylglycerol kinase family enzyme
MNPAYAYIYDDFLTDRRYQDIIAALETRLSSMGLSGRVGRLALFRSAKELVQNFVAGGATNIIIVGNDDTLNKVMWFLPDLPVVVGYIPVAEPADVATLLNVPVGLEACSTIGARLIESLDMGKLGERYFLTEAVFENTTAALQIGNDYRLSLIHGGTIKIRNLGGVGKNGYSLANARDGLLDVIMLPSEKIKKQKSLWNRLVSSKTIPTTLSLSHGQIISEQPVEVRADRFALNGFNFSIQSIPQKLKIITGRMRRLG